MPITFNGSGTVTGISAGGLPDGCITAAELATGVGGKILQVLQGGSNTTASSSVASQAIWDIGIEVSITPANASNKILLQGTFSGSTSNAINNFNVVLQKKTGSGSFANITAANGAADGIKLQFFLLLFKIIFIQILQ